MKNPIQLRAGLAVLAMWFVLGKGLAQNFSVVAAIANGSTNNDVTNSLPGNLTNDPSNLCAFNALTPGLLGNSFGAVCFSRGVLKGDLPLPNRVTSYGGSRIFISGDGSNQLGIRFKCTVANYSCTDDPYSAIGDADLNFNGAFDLSGVAPGTNVTIYYRYRVFAGASTAHETQFGAPPILEEDVVWSLNTFDLNGNTLFPGNFNFSSPGAGSGWNAVQWTYGTFNYTVGNNFTVDVMSDIHAQILESPSQNICIGGFQGQPSFNSDQSDAILWGNIDFGFTPFYEVPDWNENAELEFSLDIGSDAAWGDLQQDGDEFFDPGDTYYRSTTFEPAPIPVADDQTIFDTSWAGNPLIDPLPDQAAAVLPYHALPSIDVMSLAVFDLDDSDRMDFNLQAFNNYPIMAGNPANYQCLYPANYFLLSFDDDQAPNWSSPPASLPIEENSPANDVYGPSNTEVFTLEVDPYFPIAVPVYYPLLTEELLHANLAPEPDPANQTEDDDCDALDYFNIDDAGNPMCDYFYFSADREGTFMDFLNGSTLDPGTIYQYISPGVLYPAVTPQMLGLLPGVDIDAFEFGLYEIPGTNTFYLALFFSVDDDDPFTPEDESAGLKPNMIYVSMMNGISFDYLDSPTFDDIDALAIVPELLYSLPGFCNQTGYFDGDGDGFGDSNIYTQACVLPPGYVLQDGDCDDGNPAVFPGAIGTQQGIDNNCNGIIDPDEECIITVFEDIDGDSYGGLAFTIMSCVIPPGYVWVNGDCDDSNPAVYPGAPGTQQGIDNNCDGVIDQNEKLPCPPDVNGDGVVNSADLLDLLAAFGCTSNCGSADVNGDGQVNAGDLLDLLAAFGSVCP